MCVKLNNSGLYGCRGLIFYYILFQVPPWRESRSPKSRRQTVHLAGPIYDSQGNEKRGSSRSSPSPPRQLRPSWTTSSPPNHPTPRQRPSWRNRTTDDYESLDRDDNYVIMDKSILKVYLPTGGFNVVKCADATDVKVGEGL